MVKTSERRGENERGETKRGERKRGKKHLKEQSKWEKDELLHGDKKQEIRTVHTT